MIKIYQGDCRKLMANLPEKSVESCVTSPPYFGLRDYGNDNQIGDEKTPDEYISALVTVFREVRRVLRDDGTVWLNLGDSYINKNLVGIPWRVAFALQADGWYLRQDIIWSKPNPMPESVEDRCTKAHEYIFLLSKSPKYYFDNEHIKEETDKIGGKPRQFGATKQQGTMRQDIGETFIDNGLRNKRSVWTVSPKPFSEAHFAVYPPELIEPCILAGCPEGGTVLDPFGGSGTTGVVADRLGRDAVMFELNSDYIDIASKRIKNDGGMFVDLKVIL